MAMLMTGAHGVATAGYGQYSSSKAGVAKPTPKKPTGNRPQMKTPFQKGALEQAFSSELSLLPLHVPLGF